MKLFPDHRLPLLLSASLFGLLACAQANDDDPPSSYHRVTVVLEGEGRASFTSGITCDMPGTCTELRLREGRNLSGQVVMTAYRGWRLVDRNGTIVTESDAATIDVSYFALGSQPTEATLYVTFGQGSTGSGSGAGGTGGAGGGAPTCEHSLSTTGFTPGSYVTYFGYTATCPPVVPSNGTACDDPFYLHCIYAGNVTNRFTDCDCTSSGPSNEFFVCNANCPTCIRNGDTCSVEGTTCLYPGVSNAPYDAVEYTCLEGTWSNAFAP